LVYLAREPLAYIPAKGRAKANSIHPEGQHSDWLHAKTKAVPAQANKERYSVNSNLPSKNNIDSLVDALAGISNQLERLFENQIQSEWMNIEEAAEYLKTKNTHIRDLVYKREIPYSKLGGLLRFHRTTLDRWLLKEEE
jgi:excisionase family DNA binding protein